MYKKINLSGIVISEPKSVKKYKSKESIANILPKYYQTVTDQVLKIRKFDGFCWFCKQKIEEECFDYIETLYGERVGFFCSKMCRDSLANMVKGVIALREEPKIFLLPLDLYEQPNRVIGIINEYKHKRGLYGSCMLDSKEDIKLVLRCHYDAIN